MSLALVTMVIQSEHDVVFVRQRARHIATLLGFDNSTQVRIATSVSEIARNAYVYAGGGRISFRIEGKSSPQLLEIVISDSGKGIERLELILSGGYKSSTGMGMGIIGSKRLMDTFEIDSTRSGTTVRLGKLMPRNAPLIDSSNLSSISNALAQAPKRDAINELQQQNQELIATLEEIRRQKEELASINSELEDTNRGVVALYAELDERAEHLKRADDMKSRFLSNMSHEFRTPLNSTIALARLLLNRADGDLTPEQEKQVHFIQKNAMDLSQLVDDLLDLAKIEAGRIVVRPAIVNLNVLFSTLRGMLRPLLIQASVELIFDIPDNFPEFVCDEGKISQILRNFISNAIKFTEKGTITVKAVQSDENWISLSVQDSGIGIPHKEQSKIFDEFHQVENVLQKKYKGTGLGLPLSKKLAALIKGRIELISEPGQGSTFTLVLPLAHAVETIVDPTDAESFKPFLEDSTATVLCIEDSEEYIHLYSKYLQNSSFKFLAVKTLFQAQRVLEKIGPVAIILDINLGGEDSWHFITDLKKSDHTAKIPVLVISEVDDGSKALALGANHFIQKPVKPEWLIAKLLSVTRQGSQKKVLIAEDDDAFRYALKGILEHKGYQIYEARSIADALALNKTKDADAILMSFELALAIDPSVFTDIRSRFGKETALVLMGGDDLIADRKEWMNAQQMKLVSRHEILRSDRESNLERILLSEIASKEQTMESR